MSTLDQKRAALAFEHVSAVGGKSNDEKKKYATMVHHLPSLLRSAGLSQALHFVRSRKSEPQRQLLEHLAIQLKRVDPGITSPEALLKTARDAELDVYLCLTHEALACAAWYRRFVQGELGIEASEGDDNA